MSEKPDSCRADRLSELSDRYAFHFERWAEGRTPIWARGAFDTHDMVRQTLIDVARTMEHVDPGRDDALLARVRRALYDNVLDRVRAARDEVSAATRHLDASLSPELSLHDPALGADLLERYEAALKRLPPLDREAVIARAELGLPWSDVTDILEKPGVAAARITVSRALVRLAREMSHERHG